MANSIARPDRTAAVHHSADDCRDRPAHTTTELAELFNVARSTVHRAIRRAGIEPSATDRL
ncbi:DNA-binding protein [Rhodococcus sp. ABRD24]|nr:DNA-binding protein [Rhodococcus sp. ABRD24]